MCIRQLHQLPGTPPFSHSFINVNVNVNVEFKVTLYEQVRYRDTCFRSVGLSFRWDIVPVGWRFAACCLLIVMKFIRVIVNVCN